MTLFDTILALVAAAAAITGYRRGLVGQLASLAGMTAGFAACYAVGDEATALLRAVNPACEQWPGAGATVPAVAHCVLFLLVMLTVRVAGLFVKNVAGKWGVTSLADRLGGVALSALKWLLVLSVLLNVWLAVNPGSDTFTTRHALDNRPFEGTLRLAPALLGAIATDTVPSPAPADATATAP